MYILTRDETRTIQIRRRNSAYVHVICISNDMFSCHVFNSNLCLHPLRSSHEVMTALNSVTLLSLNTEKQMGALN